MRPKIGDVAALAGVSTSAVSFVFNDRPGVSSQTRTRISKAADQLGWYPSAQARALSSKKSSALGLVIHRHPELLTSDPFFTQFVTGVELELSRRHYALMLQVVPDSESELASYRRLALDGRVDGVFLIDLRSDDPRLTVVSELELPAVIVGPVSAPGFDRVTVDDAAGVHAAVAHLVELGHVSIAHVTGSPGYVHSELRRRAWEQALGEFGLRPGPVIESDFSGAGGALATNALLDRSDPPTAIFYANDLMAIAGMRAAGARGVVVPDELSIIGFDDVPLAPYAAPALTTVRQDVARWGEVAARVLLARINKTDPGPIVLPTPTLIVRGSTAPRPLHPARCIQPHYTQPHYTLTAED